MTDRILAVLRWLLGPSDLVSPHWLKDHARRESGSGIEQSSIDWNVMKRREL